MSSQYKIVLHVAEVACAAGIVGWIFALLTWRRVLAHRALAFLVASAVLLILLRAPPLSLGTAIVCVVVIVLLEFMQSRLTERPNK
jgi:hypothetical protein